MSEKRDPAVEPQLPNEAHEAAGSRLQGIFDDIVSQTERDVQSWLDASDALCRTAHRDDNEVLLSLARTRGQTIAEDLSHLKRMYQAFGAIERRIRVLRGLYRESIALRDAARRRTLKVAIHDADEVAAKLLDAERKRGNLVGEGFRLSQRAQTGAKELYGQVSALSGHGRVDKVVGLREVGQVPLRPHPSPLETKSEGEDLNGEYPNADQEARNA